MAGIKLGNRFVETETIRHRAGLAAAALGDLGIGEHDVVALCLRNDFAFFETTLAADMLGAYATPLNWHCSADEAGYILRDCSAKALVVHADLYHVIADAVPAGVHVFVVETPPEIAVAYSIPAELTSFEDSQSWEALIASSDHALLPRRVPPISMFYTSGTTGRPKGVRREPLRPDQIEAATMMRAIMFGAPEADMVAVVTGPLYHAAPNAFGIWMLAIGATIILQVRFDPEELLEIISRERATHMHMVPTMFVRLLSLPAEARQGADISSLRYVVHGAAPCPDHVKEAMIDWWGPVVHEYYASTETGLVSFCTAKEWLDRPGTVGRAVPYAEIVIIDEDGKPLPQGEPGEIACRNFAMSDFTYHGAEEQRREASHQELVMLGDVGWLDGENYLYLSGRTRDMIISGGVNIYPAEVEAALLQADGIEDCAVFGIPDEEFGECVHAVVQPGEGRTLDEAELREFLRGRIAAFKVPRRIDFVSELPRQDSGKIFKAKLRAPFWEGSGRSI